MVPPTQKKKEKPLSIHLQGLAPGTTTTLGGKICRFFLVPILTSATFRDWAHKLSVLFIGVQAISICGAHGRVVLRQGRTSGETQPINKMLPF